MNDYISAEVYMEHWYSGKIIMEPQILDIINLLSQRPKRSQQETIDQMKQLISRKQSDTSFYLKEHFYYAPNIEVKLGKSNTKFLSLFHWSQIL